MPFYPIKVALWVAFAAALTLGFLSRFSGVSLALIACVVCVLTYWLLSHRDKLKDDYLARSTRPKVKAPSQLKITPRQVFLGMVFLGLYSFYFAYAAIHGDSPGRRERLVHDLFGTTGVVAFWVIAGTVLMSFGIEMILGASATNSGSLSVQNGSEDRSGAKKSAPMDKSVASLIADAVANHTGRNPTYRLPTNIEIRDAATFFLGRVSNGRERFPLVAEAAFGERLVISPEFRDQLISLKKESETKQWP